jgi:DNA-binding transcriptional MerR regulator
MEGEGSYTLSDIARMLDVPQHRLIHLCEKGVVTPEVHDAAGRGSSRVFSTRNLLELAVALRLREAMLPISAVGAIVHVLRALEERLRADIAGFSLAESLHGAAPRDLRIVVSDGQTIYFSLAGSGQDPRLFGGIRIEDHERDSVARDQSVPLVGDTNVSTQTEGFGGPEHSRFARLELSVTAVAQALPLR